MSYSDDQMVIASQIAYFDFDEADFMDGKHTLRELLDMEAEGATEEKLSRIKELTDHINQMPNGAQCWNWSIIDICNDQHGSGMYACTIDTADGDALISFRGSESDTIENIEKDWGGSDLGLLNSTLTPQQKRAQEYTREIWGKYGDDYNCFGFTGHSLGGNLAEHAGITAPDSMRDKIKQCVSLDGPGFSENYMTEHAAEILKSKKYLTHYQWSVIGTLLYMVPAADNRTIQADTPDDHGWMNMLWRHDTHNVTFDDKGNVISGQQDDWAKWSDPISKVIDMRLFLIPQMQLFPLISDMRLIHTSFAYFQDICRHWEDWVDECRKQFIGTAVFTVKPAAIAEDLECLSSDAAEVFSTAERVRDIEKGMQFQSLSADYIKCSLWLTATALESASSNLKKYIDTGRMCLEKYQCCEKMIKDSCSVSEHV